MVRPKVVAVLMGLMLGVGLLQSSGALAAPTKFQLAGKNRNQQSWHNVTEWEGDGIKDTETFSVPSREWRIVWSTEPGQYGDMNFQIYVYHENGALETVAANVIGYGSNTSYIRGGGDYYLKINSGQPYKIKVEAKY